MADNFLYSCINQSSLHILRDSCVKQTKKKHKKKNLKFSAEMMTTAFRLQDPHDYTDHQIDNFVPVLAT